MWDMAGLCVLVPILTEHLLRFSIPLDDAVPQVRFERVSVR